MIKCIAIDDEPLALAQIAGYISNVPFLHQVGACQDAFKAMQLIDAIEPTKRSYYGGCIGFIGLTGELNQAIVIRTFISRNGELWFQAGSGIVAKSNDSYELEESNNKLGALVKAIHIAENL